MVNTLYGVLKKTSLEKRAGQKHPEDGLQTIGDLWQHWQSPPA
jgi:hypothetical protein